MKRLPAHLGCLCHSREAFPNSVSGPDVASFYHLSGGSLSGKICNDTACFIARHRNPERWTQAEQQAPHVYCLGQCFAAPAAVGSLTRPDFHSDVRHPIALSRLLNGGARTLTAYRQFGGYRALEIALKQSPDEIIQTLEVSELRGRGGAGYPVGRKWRSAAWQDAPEKFIIANADEGDAGTYLDRFLLEDDPHAVIEGMLIAAHAVGATRGWVYLLSLIHI